MRRAATVAAVLLAPLTAAAAAQAQPAIKSAVAVSGNQVRLYMNETVDPNTVQPGDFLLAMADADRPLTAAVVGADPATILISSNQPWFNGEAGAVRLAGPGAIAGTAGDQSVQTEVIKVGGAPGDFVAPPVRSLKLSPSTVRCWQDQSHCGSGDTRIIFQTSQDPYRGLMTVYRGKRKIGTRRLLARPGRNVIHFDGRINGHLLRPGTYRLQIAVTDLAGNTTARPPSVRLAVR